jgi:hypothetical protein
MVALSSDDDSRKGAQAFIFYCMLNTTLNLLDYVHNTCTINASLLFNALPATVLRVSTAARDATASRREYCHYFILILFILSSSCMVYRFCIEVDGGSLGNAYPETPFEGRLASHNATPKPYKLEFANKPWDRNCYW